MPDHIQFVLDDEERIARRLQLFQRHEQRLGVRRMQAGRRFVEHIDDAEKIRAHLRGKAEPLEFAGRKRGRAAVERKVAEPEIQQHGEPRAEILRDALGDHGFLGMLRRELRPAGCLCLGIRTQNRGQALQAAGWKFRRYRARQISPTAPPRAAACRGRPGIRCSPCSATTRFFIEALSVLAKVSSTYFFAPVKVPM